MSEFIYFKGPLIEGAPTFTLTNAAVDGLREEGFNLDYLLKMTQKRSLLFKENYKKVNDVYVRETDVYDKTIEFLFDEIVCRCIIKEESGRYFFLIKYIKGCEFNTRTLFMRYGKSVSLETSITFINNTGGEHYCFYDGRKVNNTEIDEESDTSISAILEILEQEKKEKKEISLELENKLDLALKYAQADYDFSEKEANDSGELVFDGVMTIDYERYDNTAYRFRIEGKNLSNFAVEDQVTVTLKGGNRANGSIVNIEGKYVDVLFSRQLDMEFLPKTGRIAKYVSEKVLRIQKNTVAEIMHGESSASYMEDLFNGKSKGFSGVKLEKLYDELSKSEYPPTPSQWEAIRDGINAKDYFFVKGPPGTGKTTVILEWVKYFVKKQKKRVLVSSYTNNAVDNVLERLEKEEMNILRIASEENITERNRKFSFNHKIQELRKQVMDDGARGIVLLRKERVKWEEFRDVICGTEFSELANKQEEYDEQISNEDAKYCRSKDAYLEARKEILAIRKKADELLEDIRTRLKKEAEIAQKPAVLRFFINIFKGVRKRKIRSLRDEYTEIKSDEAKRYKKYVSMAQKVNESYERLVAISREALENAVYPLMEIYGGAKEILPEENELGIFPLEYARGYDVASEDVLFLKRQVEEAVETAVNLERTASHWHEELRQGQLYAFDEMLLSSVNVVGATCIGAQTQERFADMKFDVTIIDESGQIHLQNVIVPMNLSPKLIMLGDDMQMPPSVSDQWCEYCRANGVDVENAKKSLFEQLYYTVPEKNRGMLKTQFRMPAQIAQTLSDWFYENQYGSVKSKENMTNTLPVLSEKPFILIDTSRHPLRRDKSFAQGDKTQHKNILEAQIVGEIVENLAKSGYPVETMGIIAGLKAQVACIKEELHGRGLVQNTVATLDSYQGQERDIIIFSFTRSSNIPPNRIRVGFLNELRRLNVALSRAKKALVVIGDFEYLAGCQCVTDRNEELIKDERLTEKYFGQFIKKLVKDAKETGEIIPAETALKLLERETYRWDTKTNSWKTE